ncbi:MAG TPA: hypothetical protein VJZ00_19705 [Thermoanaerobaculia bacterium]|nr:hypothetical protein [Thermoanaerobaculia bacterium]
MTRRLEIFFYGLACFDPQGAGYRVLFPDGRNPAPFDIPPHRFALWENGNKHPITTPATLVISGLKATPLHDLWLRKRLPSLQKSDPNFTIDSQPVTIVQMTIDRGILTAHQDEPQPPKPDEAIVVRWAVEAEDDAEIEFAFGAVVIRIPDTTEEVVLENASDLPPGADSDFNLYRKISTDKNTPLGKPLKPAEKPLPGIPIHHGGIRMHCPFIDCSIAFSHY